ncbi:16S rRNA (cytidine(1402)-2'-O)-methyltransferase [Brochothrix thermosphacta]|uniref:16S rRNA (cytidine(1402)-2'-O)-methyltransferase n=1 Tax=Brochothrix thermosphacta TaxID=2756 RepID=UPI0003E8B179|nr:16S rRNA (cytidine(1402)-2'-O)-methyltransferase [Brochothrix thermosphacta]EUJ34397.1 putative methyltransferase [Brochothrix thermosphacta DSM 20171 = FSL F6-1036]ODJ49023.1 16S rRNA (cytidine(1402)-2'-O)-methyltransferase [Brochothrix thermosphacta DSM 20171 = FSL F6-1036]
MQTQQSFQPSDAGKLYLVPTPIGNLEDMTFRAIKILKEVDAIAAEDTRNTIKLLNHFEIKTPMVSYHEHNKRTRGDELVQRLLVGENIAQVSDAGMPSISDPGHELVLAATAVGITVVPLPGANAALTALISSGITPQPFLFYGFISRSKKERQEEIEKLAKKPETLLFYESPHRLKETLNALYKGMGNRQITLCRELTKRYEEFIRGTIEEIIEWAKTSEIRGEFVIVVAGNNHVVDEDVITFDHLSLKEHVEEIMAQQNLTSKQAIKEVAVLRGIAKREVYAEYHDIDESETSSLGL